MKPEMLSVVFTIIGVIHWLQGHKTAVVVCLISSVIFLCTQYICDAMERKHNERD